MRKSSCSDLQFSNLWLAECIGVVFTFIVSGLIKPLFTMTGFIPFSVISPVNQSIWEQLKIIVTPYLVYSVIEYLAVKPAVTNFVNAKKIALIALVVSNCALFYTMRYIIPHFILIGNVICTLITLCIGFYVSYKMYIRGNGKAAVKANSFTAAAVIILLICLVGFTFWAPKHIVFMDPVTETYGISTYYINQLIVILQEFS